MLLLRQVVSYVWRLYCRIGTGSSLVVILQNRDRFLSGGYVAESGQVPVWWLCCRIGTGSSLVVILQNRDRFLSGGYVAE